ncbi:arylsulfatase [Membranihabitans marinus]
MADDLGYGDLGCYGQKLLKTPNIDQLAEEGIRFLQAYAGGPVCTPSRSVLMTGLHNGHTPARDNVPHYNTYLEEEDVTIAEVLKTAGYKTGGIGKWSLGDAGTVGSATNQGFDFYLGYLNQDHAHFYYPEYLDFNEKKMWLKDNTIIRDRYSHDILTNGALQFIRESKREPFFLYAAYTLPHYSSSREDEDGLTVPNVNNFYNQNWPIDAKKYATMIEMLDRDVGRIVDLVKSLGLEENTIIVFTSDNGGHSSVWKEFNTSGPLSGYKRDLNEGGIRVPFIVKWKGHIPENKESSEIIAFQDMLPTFAALANVKTTKPLDGVNIVDALMGEKIEKPHKYLYWDYGHNRLRYDQAVRFGNWKGIKMGREGEIMLYNLEKDIGEFYDVASDHPKIVEQISDIMKTSVISSEKYPIGETYQGSSIWKKTYNLD